ncbi:aspartyl-phosphate phosphatase Spo0E family protein [Cohnella cellulosilytica]|uniref:Aspartyl-phosphate phosphatase Spo0E family protein n=1 Tax=Cohnella cellulosilytica TaxID=986710 RepID=A0ABW2FHT4_9BACL
MKELMHNYEKEKTKLNELGQESLAKGIPLSANETVLAQSRRVDELITRFYIQRMVKKGQGDR